jgi:drug/metabolite transporter (DMT)-like permease
VSPLSRPAQGHLAMLLFSGLVAGSFALGSRIANQIDPVALTVLRFVLAAAIIAPLAALTGAGLRARDFRAPWRFLLLGGVFATYFILMFEGLKTAPPVSAAAVFTLTPILAAGFGWLLLRQRATPRIAVALVIGGAAALWVVFRADLSALMAFRIGRGEAIYFWGCVAHAVYAPLVTRLNRGEGPLAFTLGMLGGAILAMLVWGWGRVAATDWMALPVQVWIGIGYLAVFASASTFVLLQFAALRLPAAKVMAYTYLTPSWVILWEIALGGAAPPPLILAGVGLSVLALALLLKDEPGAASRRKAT